MNANPDSSLREELVRVIADIEKLENGGEPIVSKLVQEMVKRDVGSLESLTRSVSQLSMFSENEDVGEIATDSLRFLLLPALLGFLTGKLVQEDRLEILEREQAYYQDFLRRLQSYGVVERKGDEAREGLSSKNDSSNVVVQSRNRQEKIERYNERKRLQEKLEILQQRSKNSAEVDEDLLRDLYVTELKLWAGKIFDSVETVKQEISLLRMRASATAGASTSADAVANQRPTQPLKPFIITRTDLQKAVYGAGYPSVPTMSLEEFFEQKRKEGQIRALSAADDHQTGPLTEEDEKILRENKEEREDSDLLQHDRHYDEYRDDHRRGWGNMHNKG